MGYFNYFIKCIIRKIVNSFFSRRKLTKLFIISLIFCAIIMLLHNEGYCQSSRLENSIGIYSDITQIISTRENIFSDFLKQFTYWYFNIASDDLKSQYQSVYYELLSESTVNNNIYISSDSSTIYFYDKLNITQVIDTSAFGTFNVPSAKVVTWKNYCYSFSFSVDSSDSSVPPFSLEKKEVSSGPLQYLPTSYNGRTINYVLTPEILSMVNNSNNAPVNKGDIDKINDSINNDNVEDSSITMVEDSSENPTDTGFDNIFTTIYNAFCNTSSTPLNITIPYIDESFIIQPNMLSSSLKKDSRLNALLFFIQSFWWFKISLFIFKDVNNYIEEFKNGNITTDDGNIKTEVL